jgi:hypothetical protein
LALEPRRCQKSLPIRLRRRVIACIPGLDSRNLDYLLLIPFCLARQARRDVAPKEAPAIRVTDRLRAARRHARLESLPAYETNRFAPPPG